MKDNTTTTPRLRLAPSPTGFLHLGNFRTALFTYLLAKHWGGKMILRIEDTDTQREVPGAVESLVRVLAALGITFDEGPEVGGPYAPYIQSQRLEIYREHAFDLVAAGKAYPCFATPSELEAMRAQQAARHEAPRYDRRYRNLDPVEAKQRMEAGEPYVIRQAMPLEGVVTVTDELRGEISFPAADLEDHVLLKSDGRPTYQLASVVDDHLMGITHVTRGDEWLPSFPKNILLYQAFGWEPPRFIHLPLMLNKGGGKLSKRQGDVFVEDYLAKGYLPAALINFCALLGWHPKDDTEILSLTDLIERFDLEGIGVSPAVFDQEKLDYLNGYYIRQTSLDDLLTLAKPFFEPFIHNATPEKKSDDFLRAVLALEQPRLTSLDQVTVNTAFFFASDLTYEPTLLIWKKNTAEQTLSHLQEMATFLEDIPTEDWTKASLEERVVTYLKADNKPLGDYLWPLRVAVSGQKVSPSPFEIMGVLKKAETLARISRATRLLQENVL